MKGPIAAGDVDLKVYVAGLNHNAEGLGGPVGEKGLNELAQFIAADKVDPSTILIALSASGILPTAMRITPSPGHTVQCRQGLSHAECLALALRAQFGTAFTVSEDNGDRTTFPVYAAISGSRWHTGTSTHLKLMNEDQTPASSVFEVEYRDTREGSAERFRLYLMHTKNDPEARADIKATLAEARNRARPGEMLPLLAGDLNLPTCDGDCFECLKIMPGLSSPALDPGIDSNPILIDDVRWLNNGVTCAKQNGLPDGATFRMQNDKMHLLSGLDGGHFSFGCPDRFSVVDVSYTAMPDGSPARPWRGIDLPDIGHNIVGLGLHIESAPTCNSHQKCDRGACIPVCECTAPGGRGHLCDQTDTCGNACSCLSNYRCQAHRCVGPDLACGNRTCAPGFECCLPGPHAQCCNPSTQTCTVRGCEPKRTPE